MQKLEIERSSESWSRLDEKQKVQLRSVVEQVRALAESGRKRPAGRLGSKDILSCHCPSFRCGVIVKGLLTCPELPVPDTVQL